MFWKYTGNLQENNHAEVCSPTNLLHIFSWENLWRAASVLWHTKAQFVISFIFHYLTLHMRSKNWWYYQVNPLCCFFLCNMLDLTSLDTLQDIAFIGFLWSCSCCLVLISRLHEAGLRIVPLFGVRYSR